MGNNSTLLLLLSLCASQQYDYSIGDFEINIANSSDLFELKIYHKIDLTLVHSITYKYKYNDAPFIQVAFASLVQEPISGGNFKHFLIGQQYHYTSSSLTLESIQQNATNQYINISGLLLFDDNINHKNVPYSFILRPPAINYPYYDNMDKGIKSNNSIDFNITINTDIDNVYINRIFLRYDTNLFESFMGFGQQYSFINFRGKIIPILISEQGVGRGDEPVTTFLNEFGNGAGGNWHTSYGNKAIYITNCNRSFLMYNYEIIIFDLTHYEYVQLEVYTNDTNMISGRIIYGETPIKLISEITLVTGRQKPLPPWILKGGILGIEGGQDTVYNITSSLIQHKPSLIGLWIQDWVGSHIFSEGTRLLWNWELNTEQYPDWAGMFRSLSNEYGAEIKRLTYINPYFANVSYLSPNGFANNYFEQGVHNNYFIMNSSNMPYLINSISINFATVDLTNPAAVIWIKNIIKQNMINNAKSSGFMADFGEYIPFDAVFYDKNVKASFYHNQFAQHWAKIVCDAIDNDEIVAFHRSSALLSPLYAHSFWFGDQLVTFDSRDGIESLLYALFSANIMGHTNIHSDIGGYTMLNSNMFSYTRSEELLLRWMELSAFSDTMFRSHPGNIPSSSYQIYSTNATINHFVKFSNIFGDLGEYKLKLMNDSYFYGVPLVRHLFFNYPNDENVRTVIQQIKAIDNDDSQNKMNDEYVVINQEFLLGDCMLVAPVLYPNVTQKTIYLPKGEWISYWNKQIIYKSNGQFYPNITCPLGQPPVFVCGTWNYTFARF